MSREKSCASGRVKWKESCMRYGNHRFLRTIPKPRIVAFILASVVLVVLASPGSAAVRLPRIFGDHMVLQREMPLAVWGWADPGEKVAVDLGGQKAETAADAAGRWKVALPPMKSGGPLKMTVSGKNRLVIEDILIGEVWLCSGQSNMEWILKNTDNAEDAIRAADVPEMRLLTVERRASPQPLPDVKGAWAACTPETAGGFSAVGYYFGRKIYGELKVPIGLINSSWGGTLIECWTPAGGFELGAGLEKSIQQIQQADQDFRRLLPAALDDIENWTAATRKALKQGRPIPLLPEWPKHPIYSEGFPEKPTALYNGMIHPLVPYPIRGALWYQGEANAISKDGMLYYEKMKALIGGWRKAWGEGDFPFYFVEIAPLAAAYEGNDLPKLWDAQRASLSIPNTGMAVTTDIANLKDIHPRNKLDVGNRLALWALAKDYGRKDLVFSGPLYKSMEIKDGRAVISFDHTGKGLIVSGGGDLSWWEIAGPDRIFKKAQARIDGDKVIVWSDAVPGPEAVRLGWHRDAQPNLINSAGLPASPFRTDDW